MKEREEIGEKGAIIYLLAAVLPVLVALLALAIDLGMLRSTRAQLRGAVDAGALAGAGQIAGGATTSAIITEATLLYSANARSSAQLISVETGNWNGTTFTPGGSINAVRVVAKDSVMSLFAPIINVASLDTQLTAVAVAGSATRGTCVIPLGLTQNTLSSVQYGDILNTSSLNSANWGKIDIDGNMSSNPNFVDGIINGVCDKTVSVGDHISPGTGNGGLQQGFNGRLQSNPFVLLPVVDAFPNGNSSPVTILGFVLGELIAQNGNGSNWSGKIRIISGFAGDGASGSTGQPYAISRSLVL